MFKNYKLITVKPNIIFIMDFQYYYYPYPIFEELEDIRKSIPRVTCSTHPLHASSEREERRTGELDRWK